jgi:formylmethanofuran dehydrogenase subunit E
MTHPAFFDAAPRITVRDPLNGFLGGFDGGLVEYGYLDAVKLAGHSCPTVAGAYLMTLAALRALYGDDVPERGGVQVSFADGLDEGVAGVTAAVVGLITGAAGEGGFKGIGPLFSRRGLLRFGEPVEGEVAFSRRDNGRTATAMFDSSIVPLQPEARELLPRMLAGDATPAEGDRFRQLWQERVRAILIDHADDAVLIRRT